MGDSNPLDDSIAFSLMSKLIGATTDDDEVVEELKEGAERLIPPGFDGKDLDSAIVAGGAGGLRLSQARHLADAAQRPQKQIDETPVRAREVQHPDGTVHAIRIFVAAKKAEFTLNDDGVDVIVEGVTHSIPTPFVPHEIEIEKAEDGIIEAVVETPPMIESGEK